MLLLLLLQLLLQLDRLLEMRVLKVLQLMLVYADIAEAVVAEQNIVLHAEAEAESDAVTCVALAAAA